MWAATRAEQINRSKCKILEHPIRDYFQKPCKPGEISQGRASKLTYDINGRKYCAGVKPSPLPMQGTNPGHWICQVNGTTNSYDIVKNLPPNPHWTASREEEIRRFKEEHGDLTRTKIDPFSTPAGMIQPQPVVDCHDMTSFVPTYVHAMANYSKIRTNL